MTDLPARSIPALVLDRARRQPDAVVIRIRDHADPWGSGQPDPEHPGWRQITLAQAMDQLSGLARRLHSLGVDDGVPVAILARTSQLWVAADLAVLSLGGVTVGVYPSLTGPQVAEQLRLTGARILLVEDGAQHHKMLPHLDELDELVHVFAMTPDAGCPPITPAQPDRAFLEERIQQLRPQQLASIVPTSGTTGASKGVRLTHRAFLSVIAATRRALPTQPGDASLVFLPLAHSLQRFAVYRGLVEDVVGWFCTIDELPDTIPVARPDILVTVPRMLEKIKAKAEDRASQRGPRARVIFDWAFRVGRARRHLQRHGRPVPLRLALQHRLADRLVLSKVRQGLGGRLRAVVSGGAGLSVPVAEWVEALGIRALEGWGLTETCAPATLNTETHQRLGTVGLPLPGVRIKLAPDGEVLVRGPGLFEGYHRDPAATEAAFTQDGFFRTGDLGSLDPDGFLRIKGRKKQIIVTAGGKNIAPTPLEQAMVGGIVEHAVVVGDERPCLMALLSLDTDALAVLAEREQWPGGPQDWRQHPQLRQRLDAAVQRANAGRASFETVKGYAVLSEPLSVDAGTLTPTLKLKRREIARRYADLIDSLWS